MSKEIKRTIKVGTFIFPAEWVELNPERAKECEYVAFLVRRWKMRCLLFKQRSVWIG